MFKSLTKKRLSLQDKQALLNEIADALVSLRTSKEGFSQQTRTAQECKDVWETYSAVHKASYLEVVARELQWNQLTKCKVHRKGLNILSALVWVAHHDWTRFAQLTISLDLVGKSLDQPSEVFDDLRDSNKQAGLTASINESRLIFNPVRVLKAFVDCPKADNENVTTVSMKDQRLPILKEEEIGKKAGLSGAPNGVSKAHFADGYLPEGATRNSVVALKRFPPCKRFSDELSNLAALAERSSRPDSIMICIAILEGKNGSGCIVFELASCDLSTLLLKEYSFSPDSPEDPLPPPERIRQPTYLLRGSLDVAEALEWLHHKMTSVDGKPIQAFHLDLKPDNILVFGIQHNWKWKITDFGHSSIGRHQSTVVEGHEIFWTETGIIPGPYHPPEMRHGTVGLGCDIWSFGCILLEVLAYAQEGQDGVLRLQEKRNQGPGLIPPFYHRGSSEGEPSVRLDLRDMFGGLAPWLQQLHSIVKEALECDPHQRPRASQMVASLRDLLEEVNNDSHLRGLSCNGYEPGNSTSTSIRDFSITTDTNVRNLWTKCCRVKPGEEIHRAIIAGHGQWLVVQTIRGVYSLELGESTLWGDTKSSQEITLLFEGRKPAQDIQYIASGGKFVAIMCGDTRNCTILVQQCDGKKVYKDHFKYEHTVLDISVSCLGVVLIHFEDHIRVLYPDWSQEDVSSSNKGEGEIGPLRNSAIRTAGFSADGFSIYTWSTRGAVVRTNGQAGTPRTSSWHVWKTDRLAEDSPEPLEYSQPWASNTQMHMKGRKLLVPLNGRKHEFSSGDGPNQLPKTTHPWSGEVQLQYLVLDDSGNVALVYVRSGVLYSFMVPERTTGIYQAYASLEGPRPEIFVIRKDLKVKIFDIPSPSMSKWEPKASDRNLDTLVSDYADTHIDLVLKYDGLKNERMVYTVGYEKGAKDKIVIVKKSKMMTQPE